MDLFANLAVLITLTTLFSYPNHRYIDLPATIGVMLSAMVLLVLLTLVGPIAVVVSALIPVTALRSSSRSARGRSAS